MRNNIPYVCIRNGSDHYLVPANILIKYIDLSVTPAYKISDATRLVLNTYSTVDSCPTVLKNYLENVEFKDLYFNTLANYNFDDKFIPYYNGDNLLFKTKDLNVGDNYVKALIINSLNAPLLAE